MFFPLPFPAMESVWLGGWSMDGTAWTWISTGFTLPSKKSIVTSYPPWLEGHPLAPLKTDDFHKPQSRCLILDRHLCPEKIEPVFLDLDCEKNRPFLCQDGKSFLGSQRSNVNNCFLPCFQLFRKERTRTIVLLQ